MGLLDFQSLALYFECAESLNEIPERLILSFNIAPLRLTHHGRKQGYLKTLLCISIGICDINLVYMVSSSAYLTCGLRSS